MKKIKVFAQETQASGEHIYKIIPEIAGELDRFFKLQIGGKSVTAPYYINTKRRRDLRALVGKGTADEIELEAKVWAQVKGLNLGEATTESIRELMQQVGIGIDCSGLVVHSLRPILGRHGINLFSSVRYKLNNLRARLGRILRPAENLGADDLTSLANCEVVELSKVRPGDFIRGIGKQRNAYHIAIVTEVVAGSNGDAKIIKYSHSHRKYGSNNGVRQGVMEITNPHGSILEQKWLEVHTDGRNYLYEDLVSEPEDCGFRRLKFLSIT